MPIANVYPLALVREAYPTPAFELIDADQARSHPDDSRADTKVCSSPKISERAVVLAHEHWRGTSRA